jgi:hypothetical protein
MGGTCSTCGGRIGAYRILVGKPDGKRDHLGHLGLDGTILLKWNFKTFFG